MQTFKILWFDDVEENVEIHKKKLEDYCKSHNRSLVIDHKYTYDDEILNHIMDYEYSLIVSDLNLLGSEKMGNEILQLLKEKSVFAETLLYSNNSKLLIEKTEGDNFIDGLHRHANLKGLLVKIQGMIQMCLCKESYYKNRQDDYNNQKGSE